MNLYFSDAYPVDQTRALQWADFITSLIHGPKLQTVSIHLAPLAEVQDRRHCGQDARARLLQPAPRRRSTRPPTIPAVRHEREGHPDPRVRPPHRGEPRESRRSRARTTARSAGPRTRTSARGRGRATSFPAPRTPAITCLTPARRSPETYRVAERAEARPTAGIVDDREHGARTRRDGPLYRSSRTSRRPGRRSSPRRRSRRS